MPDASSIGAAIAGLKTAADITKTFLDLKSVADVQGKVIELQSVILAAQASSLDAQSAQSSLLDEVREMKEEVARVKAWETEKQRYELHKPRTGVLTYALKDGVEPPEPAHQICANCYQNGKKSILQEETRMPGMSRVLICHSCGTDLYIDGDWNKEHASRNKSGRR